MGRKGKQKVEKEKKIESITVQIHDVVWRIHAVKSTRNALEKQATSHYDLAKDSVSDVNALLAQGNSLQKTAGEKKKLVKELEEAEKNCERGKRHCNILLRKKDAFLAF